MPLICSTSQAIISISWCFIPLVLATSILICFHVKNTLSVSRPTPIYSKSAIDWKNIANSQSLEICSKMNTLFTVSVSHPAITGRLYKLESLRKSQTTVSEISHNLQSSGLRESLRSQLHPSMNNLHIECVARKNITSSRYVGCRRPKIYISLWAGVHRRIFATLDPSTFPFDFGSSLVRRFDDSTRMECFDSFCRDTGFYLLAIKR